MQPTSVNVVGAANLALTRQRRQSERELVEAVVWIQAERSARAVEAATHRTRIASTAGGSLPPDYVIQRESRGDYNAYNPTGCGGSGCYGRYQFSGAWAGKLGLPDDLSQATPEQQDEAARQLWNGGSGCSNWSAC